ncbi:TIGR04219 family outer membrane beta-barrel protein [Microbulbifer aggregans]|uniref:TIGR04219 family outer membrane beta-barrel protein n=1 Tax=Microbulbifer aggregans TaxID=1769779 RepID=UPI001CFD2E3A|nr:TIGR04219 family outer membrane beta-barrel protein [Microbulbifer aggregans]
MKKITLAICAALASVSASADTILGFDATAGVWKPSYSGELNSVIDSSDFEESNHTFLQAALEHPIPLIPNIMLAHSAIESDTNLTSGSTLDLTHTDATLYYEILDNWVNLDIGLTARQYDGSLGLDIMNNYETVDFSGVLPMAYAMARFDLPFTGWSIIAQGNGTGYKGDTHTDLTAKVRWDFVPAADFAIEAGYRVMSLDVQELDDLEPDLEIKGPYLGLNLHL